MRLRPAPLQLRDFALGRVDGFDDDEAQSECDEGSEVLVRFLAAERNALEALELADEVFDAGAGSIERLREEGRPRTAARGVMSGPRSSRISNCGLSPA